MSKLLENLFEEPERGTLVYIPTDRINPHPDNPRKELGDLTELADSIRQNGILQNLTVVPYYSPIHERVMKGIYTVIIGHRRLAAAQLAGLTEVPCIVVDKPYKEQLQTMLQENMQRSDLTVYEQAQGFQMMLDLGETVESLAATSGFSQSTIRRRVKLLDLDEKAFKASVERGATLADYAELDKIEDPARKNRVLKAIGTANFSNELKSALGEEQKERDIATWRKMLSAVATEVDSTYEYRTVQCWAHSVIPQKIDLPDGDGPYYFHISSWGSVYLLTDKTQLPAETKEQRLQREKAERERVRVAKLREASERAFEMRAEFAADVSPQVVKEHWAEIVATWMCLCTMTGAGTGTVVSRAEVEETFQLDREEYAADRTWSKYVDCLAAVERQPEWALWLMVWTSFGDHDHNRYIDWNDNYKPHKPLDVLYDLLTVLGYEMSDEEKQLQDGTHPLFQKEV
jgi:ParB family chromosome partitioning protein